MAVDILGSFDICVLTVVLCPAIYQVRYTRKPAKVRVFQLTDQCKATLAAVQRDPYLGKAISFRYGVVHHGCAHPDFRTLRILDLAILIG